MAKGGRREGAGRPKGSKNAQTRIKEDIASKAIESGITPLEVMLEAMRDAYYDGDKRTAAQFAKDAAPYVHPKYASLTVAGDKDSPVLTKVIFEHVKPEG